MTEAAPAPTPAPAERPVDDNHVFELVIVVLLGVAATLMAFASYQDNLLGGDSLKDFSKATVVSDQASQVWNEADILSSTDQRHWLAYSIAMRDPAREDEAIFIQDELMTSELADAVDWYEANKVKLDLDSPFDEVDGNPYTIDAWDDADELDEEAAALQDNGEKLDAWGDKYGLVTVLLAIALFLFGVAAVLDSHRTRNAVTVIGVVVTVVSCTYMATLGVYNA